MTIDNGPPQATDRRPAPEAHHPEPDWNEEVLVDRAQLRGFLAALPLERCFDAG